MISLLEKEPQENEELEFNCEITQLLKRKVAITTTAYNRWDEENEDGVETIISTADIDWNVEYSLNGHYTIIQLLGILREYVKKDLVEAQRNQKATSIFHCEKMLRELEGWIEVETDIEED